jgi:hypothetical protein
MPSATASVRSPLSPEEVLTVLTDFGPGRVEAWPGVDAEHLTLHDSGDTWAEVTEGNPTTWERERYTWDAGSGTVSAVTLDSNVWAAGSRWDYRLVPDGSGTRVDVKLTRQGKGLKGKLIGALLPLVGRGVITKGLRQALRAE